MGMERHECQNVLIEPETNSAQENRSVEQSTDKHGRLTRETRAPWTLTYAQLGAPTSQ